MPNTQSCGKTSAEIFVIAPAALLCPDLRADTISSMQLAAENPVGNIASMDPETERMETLQMFNVILSVESSHELKAASLRKLQHLATTSAAAQVLHDICFLNQPLLCLLAIRDICTTCQHTSLNSIMILTSWQST